MLSKDDIDELHDSIAFSKSTQINGKEINCYEPIYLLAVGKKKFNEFTVNEIIDYIEQINFEKDFFYSIGCDELSFYDRIIKYLNDILLQK